MIINYVTEENNDLVGSLVTKDCEVFMIVKVGEVFTLVNLDTGIEVDDAWDTISEIFDERFVLIPPTNYYFEIDLDGVAE